MLDPRIEKLLSTDTIRAQARRMFEHAANGQSNFSIHLERLDACADLVVETILKNYPSLDIPFHSRWGHFRAGGVDRTREVSKASAQAKFDLVIVSVLLDAGAGMQWKYAEPKTGKTFSKSEGLAVASFRMFLEGRFSSTPDPLRCDAKGLRSLRLEDLKKGFQVSDSNPLIGTEGRHALLQSLAKALEAHPEFFGAEGRIGNLVDWYRKHASGGKLAADKILRGLQLALGSIWPGRVSIEGFNLGDVWRYPAFGEDFVPFHKLSQWLSYSLIEPLMESGLEITNPERLTGLAEYRNGGLFLDTGVLVLRDPKNANHSHRPDSELVIEWRALTVELLERVAVLVRKKLKLSEQAFPLGKVLEGGTWAAGRRVAAEKRSDGGPPLQVVSDGTVF